MFYQGFIDSCLIFCLQLGMGKNKKDEFFCCGGDDETPQEHTMDCEDHGDPAWIAEMDYFETYGRWRTKEEREVVIKTTRKKKKKNL